MRKDTKQRIEADAVVRLQNEYVARLQGAVSVNLFIFDKIRTRRDVLREWLRYKRRLLHENLYHTMAAKQSRRTVRACTLQLLKSIK